MREEDSQMLEEDESLRWEDLKIAELDAQTAQKDAELRLEDDKLRRQNARMRSMLKAMEHGVNVKHSGEPTGSESFKPHQTKGWVFPFLTISIFSLSIILLIVYKMYDFFAHVRVDMDGDGDVDFEDFKRQFSLGLSDKAFRQLGLVFLFAAGGFAFLWWMGWMQPFLGQLAVYAYILLTVAAFAMIIIAEIWTSLSGSAQGVIDLVQNVERFFRGGVENIGEAAHRIGRSIGLEEQKR